MPTILFYVKVATKNALFVLTMLFVLFFTYNVYPSLQTAVNTFVSFYVFSMIGFHLFLITIATYVMQRNESDVLRYLERNPVKKQFQFLAASMIRSARPCDAHGVVDERTHFARFLMERNRSLCHHLAVI